MSVIIKQTTMTYRVVFITFQSHAIVDVDWILQLGHSRILKSMSPVTRILLQPVTLVVIQVMDYE